MATKERGQNPVVGDTARLRFCVFNGADFADPHEITAVDIYKLFDTEPTNDNPLGRTLVTTVTAPNIIRDDTGRYHIDLQLLAPLFTQGRFQDEWNIVFEDGSDVCYSPMDFVINPMLWFTDSKPLVHSFNFQIYPNRIIRGSKQYLEIRVIPDVPRGTDKQRYYEHMVVAGSIYVSVELKCGNCLPDEEDLRMIVQDEEVTERDGCVGYYLIDATEDGPGFDCGMYDVIIEAHLGPNIYVSERQPLQIYS